ncbi:MAG: EamA family transporter [Rubrivivax sp.]|jgi:drug/metabolite transporter (DMT)-like permease|nr:EamA family transporter [Rubrivivax sp.]
MGFTRRQLALLVVLTLIWGLNWPVMKLGISGWPQAPAPYPPLTFRALSIALALPVLALGLRMLRVPLGIPRAHWAELLRLTASNMLVWHLVLVVALQSLSSGRAAILGYTMPIFSALWGAAVFGDHLWPRQWAGVAACALGVLLLLVHEFGRLAGAPWAALAIVGSACVWAYGTHRLRRSTMPVPTLAVAFWMTLLTGVAVTLAAWLFERAQWQWPSPTVQAAIAFNAFAVFAVAQVIWIVLARSLPPLASTISVMMIPVLGVFSGALALGERLHWQDFAAVGLLIAAIAAVLLPRRR